MELNYGETWIERQIEAKIERINKLFDGGKIDIVEYLVRLKSIEDYGDDCYAELKNSD
jgi:hypothetical protein